MIYVITRTQKITFVSINAMFDYIREHDDVLEGFVGAKYAH